MKQNLLFIIALSLSVTFSKSKASVVYTDIVPDSVTSIDQNSTPFWFGFPINFDGDTTIDCHFRWDDLRPFNLNQVYIHVSNRTGFAKPFGKTVFSVGPNFYPIPHNTGDTIGSTSSWSNNQFGSEPLIAVLANGSNLHAPNFSNLGDRHIGVQFDIAGQSHYGWIRVNFDTTSNKVLTVKSYAYETIPGKYILAGDKGGNSSCSPTYSTLNESICDSYTSPSGKMFTSSGTYSDTINNIGGCDSIISINLTVNFTSTHTSIPLQGCDSVLYNGVWYTSSQTLQDTSTGANGCDSISVTNINVSTCTGLETIEESLFLIYPNPTAEILHLRQAPNMDISRAKQIVIFNITGDKVHEESLTRDLTTIKVEKLKGGIYLISVLSTDGALFQGRFIKY